MANEQEFDLGNQTLHVPRKLHALNRKRLVEKLSSKKGKSAYVVLQGGETIGKDATDGEWVFRQESYFHWMFGVKESGFFGAVEIDSGKSILFIARLPESYLIWSGKIQPKEYFKKLYVVDEVYYADEIAKILKEKRASMLLTLHGTNTDSGKTVKEAVFDGIDQFVVDNKTLHPVISELRVFKTAMEIAVIRYTNKISSEAHKYVMQHIRPGMMEYELESMFQNYVYGKGGCRHVAYTCIGASGHNCATLHYGHAGAPNDKKINDGDMCLFDMGGEYYCYASDITCSFPVNGKFTQRQTGIYNAVLKANRAVFNAAKPGVKWIDMHLLADRTILEELVKLGVLTGSIEEMMKLRICALFMPHGLGHLLGCDTHDVGGYPAGTERSTEAGLKNLRTTRTLEENMVITIEPGIYFIIEILKQALANETKSKYFVKDVLEWYYGFGGVRIEDDVLITATGCENLTQVPRTVEEIEKHMAHGKANKKLNARLI